MLQERFVLPATFRMTQSGVEGTAITAGTPLVLGRGRSVIDASSDMILGIVEQPTLLVPSDRMFSLDVGQRFGRVAWIVDRRCVCNEDDRLVQISRIGVETS